MEVPHTTNLDDVLAAIQAVDKELKILNYRLFIIEDKLNKNDQK